MGTTFQVSLTAQEALIKIDWLHNIDPSEL